MQSTSNIMLFPHFADEESILQVSSLRSHLVTILLSSLVCPQCWAFFFFSINNALPTHTNAIAYCFSGSCPIFETLPDPNKDILFSQDLCHLHRT